MFAYYLYTLSKLEHYKRGKSPDSTPALISAIFNLNPQYLISIHIHTELYSLKIYFLKKYYLRRDLKNYSYLYK